MTRWLVDPPRCPEVVGRPSWMSRNGQEALPNVREWSRGSPECLAVVGRPSQMSGCGREAFPNDLE